MKAILEFNLPEEDCEFKEMVMANKLHCAVIEFLSKLRTIYKYGDGTNPEKEKYAEEFRSLFFEELSNHGLDLEIF
jgi:hypothetical protein